MAAGNSEKGGNHCGDRFAVKVVGSRGHNHAHEGLDINFSGRTLKLVLTMQSDDIAPLFDGAAWAGTQLWDAAILMIHYLVATHSHLLRGGARVLEFGCGTGVPGMCCRIMGGKVVLTEQSQLVPLLQANIQANFTGDADIRAKELSWGTKAARQFRVEEGDFDMLLACDCVFPPVYGESWFLLVDTFHEFLSKGGNPVALISWERRKSDKYDEFVSYCASKSPALQLDRVLLEEPISIYSITIA